MPARAGVARSCRRERDSPVTLVTMSGSWQWPPGWRRLRAATFARYGRACWRCGAYATTVDHVVAVVLGGTHDLSNLRPCCQHCNSSAGASVGNRLRPRRPLTAAQRRAIAVKRAEAGMPARVLRSSRDW
jgi:5-methylcytosine-specific restriction endonuclease McrA